MKHEELLARLFILPADVTELQHGLKAVQALRAVVELTKTRGGVGMKDSYNAGWVTAMDTVFQAIEKELL